MRVTKRRMRKLTDDEAYNMSTPYERHAVDTYRGLQTIAALQNGLLYEGQLLQASQAMAIIIRRNKRLGVIV